MVIDRQSNLKEKEFISQFETRTLEAGNFDHQGHVRIAWLYIRDYDLKEAGQKINQGIKAFAESQGAVKKFHLTLSTAFICLIKSRFLEGQTYDDFLVANKDLLTDPNTIIGKHYSPGLLKTDKARNELVMPDRLAFSEKLISEIFSDNLP